MDQKIVPLPTPARRPHQKSLKKIIHDFEALYLKSEIKIKAPAATLDKIIEARIHGKVFLLQRKISCGKGCGGCPHGPYWYGFYRHKGKFMSFYLGKELPRRFEQAKRIKIIREVYCADNIKKDEGGGETNGS